MCLTCTRKHGITRPCLLACFIIPGFCSRPCKAASVFPTHNAAYWTAATKGMDFSVEDRVDPQRFNRVLWQGLMGSKPYPVYRSGLDLRANRAQLLEHYRVTLQRPTTHPVQQADPSSGGGK